jgi:hypothetical protein
MGLSPCCHTGNTLLCTFIGVLRAGKAGKFEEAEKVRKQIPLAPHLAKVAKEKIGADFLIKYGFNLSEAEVEFGPDWLTK